MTTPAVALVLALTATVVGAATTASAQDAPAAQQAAQGSAGPGLQPSAQPLADPPKPSAVQDTSLGAVLHGLVLGPDGGARPDAVVRLWGSPRDTANNGSRTERATRTGSDGRYRFEGLPPGIYAAEADGVGSEPLVGRFDGEQLDAGERVERNLVLNPRPWSDGHVLPGVVGTIATVVVYLFVLLLFRFYNIIAPARALLHAQLASVKTRLDIEADNAVHQSEIAKLANELETIGREVGTVSWGSALFWSRGDELAAWSRIHEVERQLATFLAPLPRVLERVQMAEAELSTKPSAEALALAARMRDTSRALVVLASDASADPLSVAATSAHMKHQLAEALGIIYDDRDTEFSSLMEWQNKAMWLTNVALMAVVGVAVVFGHAWLLLIGGAGGLMSRLARTLFREDVPTDYGASWTTLFLSPLLGAIAGWFGIILIVALVQLGVLGDSLAFVSWPPAANPLTLGLAFVLGFSERLFTTLLSTVEGKVDAQIKGSTKSPTVTAAPSPTATAPATSGPAAVSGGEPTPTVHSLADTVIAQLEITKGERVALVGESQSTIRQRLTALVGANNVEVIDAAQLNTVAPVDGVLIEHLPTLASLDRLAAEVHRALAPNGRLVVVSTTPAGLFEAGADKQRQKEHVGPALVDAAMTAAGLLAQEPAERLDGTDPVRWVATYIKAPAGNPV